MARIIHGKVTSKFNRLPTSMIDNILKHLPLQDAARTSRLSKIWRHRWRRLPQLVFDDTFYKQVIRKNGTDSAVLLMTIYQVLLLHRGPIFKFTLSLSELESSPHIDQLIIYVLKNGIQDFTLHIWKGEPYKLPLALYSCIEIGRLDLCFCVFEPPLQFNGFKKLVSLEFRDVVIRDDVLACLISSCPLLEELRLNVSVSINCLAISAPNLRYLLCEGHFRKISLQCTPYITTCRIYLAEEVFVERGRASEPLFVEDQQSKAAMFFGSLPVVEFLELDYFYIKYIVEDGVPKRFRTTLNHLKVIKLHSICFEEVDEVLLIFCLLRSSPILENIKIQALVGETSDLSSSISREEIKESRDVCLKRLREVEMQNVSGGECEMEFVRLILAVSPNLEKMVIGPNAEKETDNGLGILKEVTRLQRASAMAEVVWKHANELPPF